MDGWVGGWVDGWMDGWMDELERGRKKQEGNKVKPIQMKIYL